MHDELPTGTVTFPFTDMEGSTRLLRELADVCLVIQPDTDRVSG